MVRLYALPLITALVGTAAGAEPRWLKITSPNFELFTTASERSGRDVARHFEQVRSFFLDAMGLAPKSPSPVRIVVFHSDKEFARYSPTEYAAAFYLATDERDYIIMKGSSIDFPPVAVHEYTHLLVKHSGVQAPVWFNEGLAEFYSNLKPMADQVEVGLLIMPHVMMLRQSKWIPLQTLLAADRESPLYNERSHAGLFYAESWALVHMLYLGKDYRPKLTALLDGIKSGADMQDTFRKVYAKSVAEVQRDLETYMRSSTFSASLFHTKLARAAEAPEVTQSGALEAGLVLAEILSGTRGRAAEARELYIRLARDYPKDWQIEAGLAQLSRREQRRDEAMAHYARAVELGSTDPAMYLTYGRMLRVADKRSEAVAVLQRATEIDPNNEKEYLEARLQLGYAYLTNNQFAEALNQLKLVKRVSPEQAFGYFHAMAYSYYRLGRKEDAEAAAAACRKYAKTRPQIEQVDHLVEALNYVPRGPVIAGMAAEGDRPQLPVAEGMLKQIDCTGGKIRMRIAAGYKVLTFVITNPGAIRITNGAAMDFTCGPQSPRRIRVHYQPAEEALSGSLGIIRTIEFPDGSK